MALIGSSVGLQADVGEGVWLALPTCPVWSLHVGGLGLPHSMAAGSFRSKYASEQQRSRLPFHDLALEAT